MTQEDKEKENISDLEGERTEAGAEEEISADLPEVTDDLDTFVDTNIGKLAARNIQDEMEESYLDYAMSVIVARALPDVRDGMKPVHRRVLYAMHDIGLKSGSKYRKSATVVGEVLGKYHPHGDVAVYDSMVRMAQDFSMRYPLVDGQGNFGSMDGDSAAAMRYTEARMTAIAEEMLADIDKDTVNFVDNYDGSRQEPSVLPARVPQLLLNGTMGIAVGMATNIPPHNLKELCNGIIHLIDNPEATAEDLTEFVKGPDFPTGGLIYDIEEIRQAYITGKGKVLMRARAEIEEMKRGFRIVVTEIPYQVNKSTLIQKIAELVKNHKIDGISDIRDESDRNGVRVVIELKSNSYPNKVLNRLYELTALQNTFHVNMLALTPSLEPRVMTLRNVLQYYIEHRKEVIERRSKYDLNRAKERAHILEGLRIALSDIDKVIETIKKSKDRDEASKNLISNFGLTQPQAGAILDMRLSALAALERQRIEDEYNEKLKLIAYLEDILANPGKVLGLIKKDMEEIKEKYGDDRKTEIVPHALGKFSAEDLIPDEQVIIALTKGNYVKRQPVDTYKKQIRGGKGIVGMSTKEEDSVTHMITASTHDDLYIFTDAGRIFFNKVYEIPATSRQSKGVPIVNVIQLAQNEKVTAVLPVSKDERVDGKYFVMATSKGVIKRTEVEKYKNIRKTGIVAIKLKTGDSLKWVKISTGKDIIVEVSGKGLCICYKESDVRPMGRSAAGVIGMKLRPGDYVVATDVIENGEQYFAETAGFPDLLIVLENGFGKRTMIKNFHVQNRGGIGIKAANCTPKTGNVVGAEVIHDDLGDAVLASKNGQFIRMAIKSIKRLGRDTQGVTLMKLRGADKVSSVTIIRPEEEESGSKEPEVGSKVKEKNETGNLKSETSSKMGKNIEKSEKIEAPKPKLQNSELVIQDSEKIKKTSEPQKQILTEKPKKAGKKEIHNSLLDKPETAMPTIRAYDPKIDLEIKKTENQSENPGSLEDVNWWGKQ